MKTSNENMNSNKPARFFPRAALTCKYAGPTNTRGARIIVTSQHTIGRKSFSWAHELDVASNYVQAAYHYLLMIETDDLNKHGKGAVGWGRIADYAHGVTHDGLHVFVSTK